MNLYIKEIILSRELQGYTYLNNIPAVRYLIENEKICLDSNITFFVGENGTGKSTLLEAIAVAYGLNPEGGSKNFNFSTKDSHSGLYKLLTLVKHGYAKDSFFLRAESIYNVATQIDAMSEAGLGIPVVESYGGVSLHDQSHGESFMSIVSNRFHSNGLYLLDEPEAALSPMKLMELISRIDYIAKSGSQFIIATHSPILMSIPGAKVLLFDENGITETDWRSTEHYKITKRFMENPDRMLKYLLEDD